MSEMYLKLALRNIKRSTKDYVIYFVTIILIVMLMYSFLALGFSVDIISMSENMTMLTTGMIILSIIVTLISSYIISYAVQFMLRQRKKEFAIYELLGMEVGTIQKLFLIENSIIGVLAFSIGLVLGIGIVGILAGVVKNIFQLPHTYQILFSFEALMLCIIFFVCMYGIGIVHAVRIIKREKIVDLLYDSRKNEVLSKKTSTKTQFIHVTFSVFAIIVGILLIGKGMSLKSNVTWIYLIASVTLLLAGIYDIYRIFPIMMIQFAKKNKKIKYTESNLFFFGQIRHRIQSSGRMMAITAILFTLSLSTMFVGLLLGAGYKANMKVYYPYDVGVAIDAPFTKDSLDNLISFVDSKCPVQDDIVYYLYDVDEYPIDALSLSDYNILRSLLGLENVEMSDDEYLVHCDTWNYTREIEAAMKLQHKIIVTGVELSN
ncbi:ABC transporter permease, partial [Methanobrevibacter sp.]|uniref:ABC transporter permease n=1 Tax=Methanobrevibacter sp. TaxID=66852 RepID=UPI00388DC957